MTDDLDDTQLDAALEALARPEPPADHVAQVLARTGPAAGTGGRAGSPPGRAEALGEAGDRPSLLWIRRVRGDGGHAVRGGRPRVAGRQDARGIARCAGHGRPARRAGPTSPRCGARRRRLTGPCCRRRRTGAWTPFEFETLRPALPRTGQQERRNTGAQGRSRESDAGAARDGTLAPAFGPLRLRPGHGGPRMGLPVPLRLAAHRTRVHRGGAPGTRAARAARRHRASGDLDGAHRDRPALAEEERP